MKEADSPHVWLRVQAMCPMEGFRCYGGRLGSVSLVLEPHMCPPTGENHSLGHSWVCVGVRRLDQRVTGDCIGGTKIVRRRYVTGKVRKAITDGK